MQTATIPFPPPPASSTDALLEATADRFRCGELGHRDALLEAGRLAHQYVLARLAQAGSKKVRPAAITAIQGRLSEIAGRKIDANRLIDSRRGMLPTAAKPSQLPENYGFPSEQRRGTRNLPPPRAGRRARSLYS